MSERKVLNKYYPPDFDPSKIPRMSLPKNRQYTVRLMAPFKMRCNTCNEYIDKGRKLNARKEDVEDENYLGIRIYRFYIKCTGCLQEISFKTDPKSTDYELEKGAKRSFGALKLAEEQAQREEDEEKKEEASNPMKILEKRTHQSKQELELLDSLEELKDLNRRRQTINYDEMLEEYKTDAIRQKKKREQEESDEEYVQSIFSKKKLTESFEEKASVGLDESEWTFQRGKKIQRTSWPSDSIKSQTTSNRLITKKASLGIVGACQNTVDSKTVPADFRTEEGRNNGLSLLSTYSATSDDGSSDEGRSSSNKNWNRSSLWRNSRT